LASYSTARDAELEVAVVLRLPLRRHPVRRAAFRVVEQAVVGLRSPQE
jgi:hypothetical protein